MDAIECPWAGQDWDGLWTNVLLNSKAKEWEYDRDTATRKFTKRICYICTAHHRKDIRDVTCVIPFKTPQISLYTIGGFIKATPSS